MTLLAVSRLPRFLPTWMCLKPAVFISLKPGETQKATITLDGEAFEYYNEMIDELSVKPGRYQILYGTSSLDQDLQSLDFTVVL